MTVTARPIDDLGTCWQGAQFPIVITFKNGTAATDAPSPLVIMSSPTGPDPSIVFKPTLVHTGPGVYTFVAKTSVPGLWVLTVHGGWSNEETPSVAHLTVLADPNYATFGE